MQSAEYNMKKILIILIAAICLSGCSGKKEPVTIKAEADKNEITIGDRVVYKVKVESASGVDVNIADPSLNLKSFEIKDHKIKSPDKKLFGGTVKEYKYVISTFTTGMYVIEPVSVEYQTKSGEKSEVKSGKININVKSVKTSEKDKDDIRDIKNPVAVRSKTLLITAVIVFLLAAAGFIYWWYINKIKKIKEIFAEEGPKRPAHEIAYERINKLEEMHLIEKAEIKEYYIILSEIIRKYIEDRYELSVLDRTTTELFKEMRGLGIDKKHCAIVRDFLEESDLVKFAKYKPELKSIQDDKYVAVKIIDETKKEKIPAEQPVQKGDGGNMQQAVEKNIAGDKK